MIPHQRAQYLFNLFSVDLVVSLIGNSPIEKQREWRIAVFPTPVSGVGCHVVYMYVYCFSLFFSLTLLSFKFFFYYY